MTREELNKDILDASKLNNYQVLELATGCGKTKLALDIINKYRGRWVIFISESNHEQNWIDEINKWGYQDLLNSITFSCYQSMHKHLDYEYYCFDEVHNTLVSEIRVEHLRTISRNNIKRFVALSATLTDTMKITLKSIFGRVHIKTIPLNTAIEWGFLPEPKVYLIPLTLDNTKKVHKYEFIKGKKSKMCTEKEFYDLTSKKIEFLKDTYMTKRIEYMKFNWLKTANSRKKFLNECKTPYIKELLKIIEGHRYICFTGSLEQANVLGKNYVINSKISKQKRLKRLENFNSGITNKIFATRMLIEGQNLNDIEVGVISQLDNVKKYFVQTHGRILRSSFPVQYIFFFKNTQDEVYINTALDGFDMKYVEEISLSDIK